MSMQDNGDHCTCTECRLDKVAALPAEAGLAGDRVTGREELPGMDAAWHAAFGAVVIVSYDHEEMIDIYNGAAVRQFLGYGAGGGR